MGELYQHTTPPPAIELLTEDDIAPWRQLCVVADLRIARLIRENHGLQLENEDLRAGYQECKTCGVQPCVNPSCCEACRRVDKNRKRGRQ